MAYAASGPGATNHITGICHAWFDSVLFIIGQVNTYEARGITKRYTYIKRAEEIAKEPECAGEFEFQKENALLQDREIFDRLMEL